MRIQISQSLGQGLPNVIWMLDYLFSMVLDGRHAYLIDGVQRALGRDHKDFVKYAREVAASGIWRTAA